MPVVPDQATVTTAWLLLSSSRDSATVFDGSTTAVTVWVPFLADFQTRSTRWETPAARVMAGLLPINVLYMQDHGFENVFQLDGGILKYFEEVGGDHYHGECFVFDRRVALTPDLKETGTVECFNCRAVVPAEDQMAESYVFGKSCGRCAR